MHKIVSVEPLSDYRLSLQFEDGLQRIVNIVPFIGGGISAALKDEGFFQQVEIESGGGIYWPNGYDFCTNFLYEEVSSDESALATS
jgi:hypothetical protein